jgi:hypothetical protein
MSSQKLHFNILTFDWPKENLIFHFSKLETDRCQRIHKSIFPKGIEAIFPGISNNGTDFVFTTFTGEREGFKPCSINLKNEIPDFSKRYYDRQINYYFRAIKKQIVQVGFIKENTVWLPVPDAATEQFEVFEKFSLKVQICNVSTFPEILLSYEGTSKVLKKSVAALITEISPTSFNWVLVNNQLHKFEDLNDDEVNDYENVYPVLNYELANKLGFPPIIPTKENKYKNYRNKIHSFYKEFLNTKEFREIIPLHGTGFLQVNPSLINSTNWDSNQMIFGENKVDIVPHNGIKTNGPYAKTPYKKIHLFFILHHTDSETAKTVKAYLETGLSWFRGLNKYVKVLFHTEPGFSIQFTDKENPVLEIEQILSKRIFNPDIKYFAIYITPYTKFEQDIQKREIYYKIKELLLKRDIPSQVIDSQKVSEQGADYVYSLTNISIAILAKLKGTPWRLKAPLKNELIVGVGAFKHIASDVQYIGSAFSFNNNGSFNRFEYFMKHELDILAGSISHQIREYATLNNSPDRLIIHFYKTMSEEELEPIQKALSDLKLDIPVFILTINKTESEDLVAFDELWGDFMPYSGTYINIGNRKFLLFNNTRYANLSFKASDGWPFPIKLRIECTDPKQLEESRVILELIDQVYQFSRMYWKSVRQQNLPVTIKYPEMVAQIAPHFDGLEIPLFDKDNLWFL